MYYYGSKIKWVLLPCLFWLRSEVENLRETIDDKNNPEVLEKIIKRSRYYSFQSKMEMCKKAALLVDNIFVDDSLLQVRSNEYNIRKKCHLHEFDFLSLVFLVNEEVKFSPSVRELKLEDFLKFINLYRSYVPPFVHKNDTQLTMIENDRSKYWDINRCIFYTRIALQQFEYQEKCYSFFYRYDWFFSYKDEEFDLKEKFKETFEVNYKEYMKIVFFLYLYAKNKNGVILFNEVIENLKVFGVDKEKADRMIRKLAITRKSAIELYSKTKSSDSRLMIYDLNPLKKNAIVIEDDKLFIPVPRLLFSSIRRGFYDTLCTEFQGFREEFGKNVFEKYVHHVLMWKKPDFVIIPEFEYKKGRNTLKSPDFTLVRGSEIIFIEVKGTMPTAQLKSADEEHYNKQLAKAYGEAIAQCVKKEKQLREGEIKHELIPTCIDAVYYVVVTLEEFHILQGEYIDQCVREVVTKKGGDIELLKTKRNHLMGIYSLEKIIENDTRSFFQYIIDRERNNADSLSIESASVNNIKNFNETIVGRYFKDTLDELVYSGICRN